MSDRAQALRRLIDSHEHFVAAEAYSALTGRIVEHVGFKAAYLGGHACSAFHYAMPDNGVFSQVEQIEQAARIADAMTIPLVADADTLGESVADAFHFAQRYAGTRVAGIHVEDEINPKHSLYAGGLASVGDMQARIAAAREGAGAALVIIARCDEMYGDARGGGGGGSLEEAVRRGRAYAEAGADALVFPLASPADHAAIVPEMPVPVCTLGFDVPGTGFTLSTGWGWVGAAKLHLERAKALYETGTFGDPASLAFPEKAALIDQPLYDDLIHRWAEGTGRGTRAKGAA